MINIPQCCSEKPYGYIEFKIDDKKTKIPLCVTHYLLFKEDIDDRVTIHGYILEADEISGLTKLNLISYMN